MAESHGINKVFFPILGSCLGMLGVAFVGLSIATEFKFSGELMAALLYLLGMPIGCSEGFLFAVWWEWGPKLKLGMFVAGVTIGAALALIVFWLISFMLEQGALIAFWTAFTVVNIVIPALGIAFDRVSNKRPHKDRVLPRGL